MILDSPLTIEEYPFDSSLSEKLSESKYAKQQWPVIYILSDEKAGHAYIGETIDALKRMDAHFKNEEKKKLTTLHLMGSEILNKSATLDIESNLIKYISGDGKFKTLNRNLGISNHNYYQKKQYKEVFSNIWKQLMEIGLVDHSIDEVEQSDLFKYSPYKSLSSDQLSGLKQILKGILNPGMKHMLVHGGAGTGKSILAVFACKLLSTDIKKEDIHDLQGEDTEILEMVSDIRNQYGNKKLNVGLVVPMRGFRMTLKKVFSKIGGLNSSMILGPNDIVKGRYDIILVDESHRLKRRKNIVNYRSFDTTCETLGLDKMTATELDWLKLRSDKLILFYDVNQSIRPSDIPASAFDQLKMPNKANEIHLEHQHRVQAGNDYSKFIKDILTVNRASLEEKKSFESYDLCLVDDPEQLFSLIQEKNKEHGLSRLVAGFAWKWVKKNKGNKEVDLGSIKLSWNTNLDGWIASENSVNEVGGIHTTQGYDLNYTGVILGSEISFDFEKDEIVIKKENYHDRKGKDGIKDPEELKQYILNIYQTILLRGVRGTYIYVCDPQLRKYLGEYIPEY